MSNGADRFVGTAAIRAALRENEAVVLDALSIPWRQGKPHISCPHNDHTDNSPSWRWDGRKRRTICTCGSYSILDVVMKVEGIDFEAAKLRAAEILSRQDLIRVRTGSKHYQQHDALSLLDPPAENRDDELPFDYLGARLGIDPADVPRPATPVIGIESLEYFDRPIGPRAKSKIVGSWRCAVFSTIAADGRMHAHRIYLSSDGRAKADLGIGPDGKPRDPKKSAKLAEGKVSTAGCAVIWGNSEIARHLVLIEGIENAAATAVALLGEIAANEIYIASAINAGGVEAFIPYPATELVTVGADRDEAKEGAGYRRGELAARTFALRNRDKVEVRIGLPGGPGESTDWVEVLLRDGVGAIRSGLLGAVPFVPTPEEVEHSRQETIQAQCVKAIAETYPLPLLKILRLEYRLGAGLRVEGDGESIVLQALKAAKPSDSIIVVSRPGWYRLPGPTFITPAGEPIGAPKGIRVELAASVKLSDWVSRRGTIEGWQSAVSAAVTAENCPHWIIGLVSAFGGVIIDLMGLESCGLNESGRTSLGKTTAQQLAVSVWSSPKPSDGGLLKSMRTTENAVEGLARDASGTILALDEMAHSDGRMIGKLLYLLASDQGKARMRSDGSLRRPHIWSTFALMSGEKSLEQKVREDGGQWTGGMAVRFPDIDVSGVNPRVTPERISAIKQIFVHYGHAGPALVTKLVASGLHRRPDALKDRVLAMARTVAGEEAESAEIRAGIPFAVLAIAGSLAQEFGILPIGADVMGVIRWAWGRFCESKEALALNPDRQAISNIQQYIAERWDVTIKSVGAVTGVNNREAIAWYDLDTVYLPSSRAPEAAGYVLGGQRIGALLEKGGYLSRRFSSRRIAIRYVPRVGNVDCYALRRSEFGRTEQEIDPHHLHPVAGL